MFEKSLQSLVKGLRAHKDDEAAYISRCLGEIKKELTSPEPDVKAQALQKLVYLHMKGYDMSWAAFHVVEVMSQQWYGHKLVGYLGASQCFSRNTDVILLTTHLFRKAFTQTAAMGPASQSQGLQYETGAAITCLSNIVTRELAEDLLSDIYAMMNSSRPYIRKKAVLVLLSVFRQWPKALRLSFDRLKEKLTDDDPGVVSAAVYVLCELARHNPKNYLKLAPLFFKIMTTSSNNWVLIKVVKLMGSLVPLEPRLAKKITGPLTEIIEVTPAKSLLYECVNTLLLGGVTSKNILQLCLSKLKLFIEDVDQNLKYLGLQGLQKLMRQHPRSVIEHKDLVLDCLDDDDTTIRIRALDLITAMVTIRNIKSIIRRLFEHLNSVDGHYRQTVLERMIDICKEENYKYIADFEWYVDLLVNLTHIDGASVQNAAYITHQLLDVVIRVEGVREFAVDAMVNMLLEGRIWNEKSGRMSDEGEQGSANPMTGVLQASAWIVGEFAHHVKNHLGVIRVLLSPAALNLLENVQSVFIQNAMKVYASALARPHGDDNDDLSYKQWLAEVEQMTLVVLDSLPRFTHSNFVEVQDRSLMYLTLIRWCTGKLFPHILNTTTTDAAATDAGGGGGDVKAILDLPLGAVDGLENGADDADDAGGEAANTLSDPSRMAIIHQLSAMFSEPLNPVAPDAQRRVAAPKGLDLNKVINEGADSDADDDEDDWSYIIGDRRRDTDAAGSTDDLFADSTPRKVEELTPRELQKYRESRAAERARRAADPFYITDASGARDAAGDDDDNNDGGVGVGDIPPLQKADFELPPVKIEQVTTGTTSSSSNSKSSKRRQTRPRGFTDDDIEESRKKYTVNAGVEVPKGYVAPDPNNNDDSDSDDLSKVNLDDPLGDDEAIQPIQPYGRGNGGGGGSNDKDGRSKSSKKKHKKKHKKRRHKHDDAAVAPAKPQSTLDILALVDGDDNNDGVVAAPAKVSPVTPVGVVVEEKQQQSSKKHKKKRKKKHHKKSSSHRDNDDDDNGGGGGGAAVKAGIVPMLDVAEMTQSSHTTRFPEIRRKVMHTDERVRVVYYVYTDGNDGRHVSVCVVVEGVNAPFAAEPTKLNDFRIEIANNNHIRMKTGDLSCGNVVANQVIERDCVFQTAKLSGPQVLKATIRYSYVYSLETKDVNIACSLLIPCSAFIHPKTMSLEEVSAILVRDACPYISSTKMRLQECSVQQALKSVSKILNVKLISAVNFAATYYGCSTQGDHVAVLVKTSKEEATSSSPSISIDIKTPKQFLCDSLLDELKLLLQ